MQTNILETSTPQTAARPSAGTRLALAGTLLYLTEWVAIIGAGGIAVWFGAGTDPAEVLDGYVGQSDAFGWAAGWLGVALMGRVLFAVAVRHALRHGGHDDPLASLGVLVMTAGVVVEVLACAVVAGTATAADNGASAATVTALDSVSASVNGLLWGALGIAVLALTAAMIRGRAFPRVLCGLGVLGGAVLTISGLAFSAPQYADLQEALHSAAILVWIWMLWTGVLLWRRTP